ncbi:cytochrome c3 family protein [Shewanella sp. UCD-KL21]|uniref:multiheme c-type cytochrome n=1 Tax=Shewanella sp. UCD-KL21 TaxID=1917164 RepID=UPI0009713F98|nr:cytochrome c3 family protein [Shewanella sp. UCD-KL21]
MKHLTKRKLAFVIAAAMGIAGCADDGKDGQDGAPGEPGPGPNPPVTEVSEVTNVTMIDHSFDEGQIRYEFEVTNEDGVLVNGLAKAEAKFAEKTERGVIMNRDGAIGGYTDTTKEGAVLNSLGDGHYEFIAPIPAATTASEGILWLRVGGDSSTQIARSQPMVVAKADMVHTATTETCQSCHVDYAASHLKHPSYAAINVDGEADLVAGCMVCHNNVSRAEENGGYATNTFQKIGHINHQKFEKDFTPTNCYTCHAEPVMNTSLEGNGCSDCHTTGSEAMAAVFADGFDAREFHVQSDKIQIAERQDVRAMHRTETSPIYWDADVELEWTESDVVYTQTGGVCTDLSLFDISGETDVQLNIGDLYGNTLTYAGAYIHGYDSANKTITGRAIGRGTETYVERESGTRSICFPELLEFEGSDTTDFKSGNFMASTRTTFGMGLDDGGYEGVSITTYSEVVSTDYYDIDLTTTAPTFATEGEFNRRHAVTVDSCTTCHNSETNFHKNGSYQEGGLDCVACHNNGQNRSSGNSAPGFGPMVHSMHWGVGSDIGGEDANSATKLNADNCVSCHADGVSLADIPNQYLLARSLHDGARGKMASPIMANCFACHNDDSAKNHMEQNGGEIDALVDPLWYETKSAESCATCHDTGKTFGIEKFHNFER